MHRRKILSAIDEEPVCRSGCSDVSWSASCSWDDSEPTVKSRRLLCFHFESDPDSHPVLMDVSVGKLTTSSSIATKERVKGSSRRCVLSAREVRGGRSPHTDNAKRPSLISNIPRLKHVASVIDVQGLLKAPDEEEAILSETMKPNVVNHTREIFLTLNRTIMAARWFHLCNPPHGTSFIRIPLVRFTADQTGVKHTFLCLPPTFSSVPSSLAWLLTGSRCICPTLIPPSPSVSSPAALASSAPHLLPTSWSFSARLIFSSLTFPFHLHTPSHLFSSPSVILLSHSSDLLVPLLVLPSEHWWLNLSLSSACRWAADGCCWSCSRRSIWGANNEPATPLFSVSDRLFISSPLFSFFPPKLRPGANVQEHLVHRLSKNKGTCCGFGVDYTSMSSGSEKVGSIVTLLCLQHLPQAP